MLHRVTCLIQIYTELNLLNLASAALAELAESLHELRRHCEASKYYQAAARICDEGVLAMQLLGEAAECELRQSEFDMCR